MKIEKFRDEIIKIAKKYDPDFEEKHKPPHFPYYRKSKGVSQVIEFMQKNLNSIVLKEKKDFHKLGLTLTPFRGHSDKGSIKSLSKLFKECENENLIFAITDTLSYMWNKNSLEDIVDLVKYPLNFIPKEIISDNGEPFNPQLSIKSLLFKPLGKTKDPRAKKILLRYLKDEYVPKEIIDGLKYFKSPDLIPYIEPLTKSKHKDTSKKAIKFLESLNKISKQVARKKIEIKKKPKNDHFNIFEQKDKNILAIDLESIDSEYVYTDLIKTLLFFSENSTKVYQIIDNFDLEEGGNILISYEDKSKEYPIEISSDWMDTDFLSKLIEDLNSKNTTSKKLTIIPSEGQDVLLSYE